MLKPLPSQVSHLKPLGFGQLRNTNPTVLGIWRCVEQCGRECESEPYLPGLPAHLAQVTTTSPFMQL